MALFRKSDVLKIGIKLLRLQSKATNRTKKLSELFKNNFGLSPLVLSQVWADILKADLQSGECKIALSDYSEKGFNKFLCANYVLWTYPKNFSVAKCSRGVVEKWYMVRVCGNAYL